MIAISASKNNYHVTQDPPKTKYFKIKTDCKVGVVTIYNIIVAISILFLISAYVLNFNVLLY